MIRIRLLFYYLLTHDSFKRVIFGDCAGGALDRQHRASFPHPQEKERASTHSHLQPLGPLKISNWKNAGLSNHQAQFPVLNINYRIFSANNFYSQDLHNAVSATWKAGKQTSKARPKTDYPEGRTFPSTPLPLKEGSLGLKGKKGARSQEFNGHQPCPLAPDADCGLSLIQRSPEARAGEEGARGEAK